MWTPTSRSSPPRAIAMRQTTTPSPLTSEASMRADRWRMTCLGAVLVVAATCAGCAGDTDGTPRPQPANSTVEPSYSTAEPSYEEPAPGGTGQEAPRVENPLDASRYLNQPCAAITPGQLSAFDVDRPGLPTTTGAVVEQAGPYCSW